MVRVRSTAAATNAAFVLAIVAWMIAPLWLVPAMMVNVDWSGDTGLGWNLAAAGSILASAVFIEAAVKARSLLMSPVFFVAALLLVLCNVQVAFDNASHRSDHRSDGRKSAIVAAKHASSQRSQWSQGRDEQAKVAGEIAVEAIEADIQRMISADAKRWQATEACDPLKTTAGPSMAFCAKIGEARAKLAAAKRRDELDAKIAELDRSTAGSEAPTSVDPFADNVASFVAMFGVKLSDDVKAAISAQRDVTRSIALELIAALGPSAWLLMVSGLVTAARAPSPIYPKTERRARPSEPPKATAPQAALPAPATALQRPQVAMDDPFHAFVSERLEDANGTFMKAGEPWQLWLLWCADNGKEPGTQKAFGGKMKTRFAHDPNNNRPRYLNVRAKAVPPALRLVASA